MFFSLKKFDILLLQNVTVQQKYRLFFTKIIIVLPVGRILQRPVSPNSCIGIEHFPNPYLFLQYLVELNMEENPLDFS